MRKGAEALFGVKWNWQRGDVIEIEEIALFQSRKGVPRGMLL
jgi:hypothetical protein